MSYVLNIRSSNLHRTLGIPTHKENSLTASKSNLSIDFINCTHRNLLTSTNHRANIYPQPVITGGFADHVSGRTPPFLFPVSVRPRHCLPSSNWITDFDVHSVCPATYSNLNFTHIHLRDFHGQGKATRGTCGYDRGSHWVSGQFENHAWDSPGIASRNLPLQWIFPSFFTLFRLTVILLIIILVESFYTPNPDKVNTAHRFTSYGSS